jgi:hypothetical protein
MQSENQMMRAVITFFSTLVAAASLCYGCARSESMDLSDRIVDAAIALKQGSQTSVEVAHPLRTDTVALIAVIPATGVDKTVLPQGAPEQLVSALVDAEAAWKGRVFLAITWPNGSSTGPTIEDHVSVPHQFSVLKPAGGIVTVRLVRDSTGKVAISELR